MNDITSIQENYRSSIEKVWKRIDWNAVKFLSNDLFEALNSKSKIFLCGNGGSASNANHLANDLLYGISSNNRKGLKVHSLTANVAVNTCLANDRGYENIFSDQLITLADKNDILIVFSGSGNSLNVVEAMHKANAIGMKTHAILGFDGGKCKDIAGNAIHIPIDNMQIAEDFQMMIGHILMLDLKGRN